MNEEIKLLLIPQIQPNQNEHLVLTEAIGATVEHANNECDNDDSRDDEWDDYISVSTPVASEVEDCELQPKVEDKEELESDIGTDGFPAEEQPLDSIRELRVLTPTRSPSPASTNDQDFKLSEIKTDHKKNE